ncbi:MAG: trigger factor [Planctomycetota bacterium]
MSTSLENVENDTEKPPLQLDVKVSSPEACVREVVVSIQAPEVQRYLKEEFDKVVPEAKIPGFRNGRAPRKLVEKQFRESVADRVKGQLLMESLSQVTEQEDFSAIGEPDFDYNSIPEPGEGPFTYQFTIEVRPEFETPNWKGLALTKPVETVDDGAVDKALERVMRDRATYEATDEPAELGDRLVVTLKFREGDESLSTIEEEAITLAKSLSFTDGLCESFGDAVAGKKEGDTATVDVKLGAEVENADDRKVTVDVEIVEVMKLESIEITPSVLEELGDFESEDELRGFIADSLKKQADYRTQQALRESVVGQLSDAVNFDLPGELVKRQTQRELQRRVMELRRSGFDDTQIQSFVNAIRQNARSTTEASLKEHFVLEQIAEDETIDASPEDYEKELELIAEQSGQSIRAVRAQFDKSGQMDALRNQIVERKVIELITENAKVTEEEVSQDAQEDGAESFPISQSILGTKDESAIPEAKYEDNAPASTDSEKDKD